MTARSFQYPAVDHGLLEEIVKRICAVGHPQRIILFGSRGRGDARPDSDIDLLIIEESNLPRYKRSARYRRALTGLFPAKDILVWTPDEIRAWSAVKNAFICVALREGRVLHER
ncbi:MAG: nucleotidyltransferase domain-containing protein [Candidatus Eisenbacteria sp.]|nr:nucleotidyltransferase domain-containing protein [Candidatus Eisenbacteria bacterium]